MSFAIYRRMLNHNRIRLLAETQMSAGLERERVFWKNGGAGAEQRAGFPEKRGVVLERGVGGPLAERWE